MTAVHVASPNAAEKSIPETRLTVEYWTVAMSDQASCGSCDATLSLVNDTLEQVRPLAEQLGIAIEVTPRTVASWPAAVEYAIAASPTLRAAGHELRPSHPDESGTRVWSWRGEAGAAPSPQAVLDFLVQAVAAHSRRLGDFLARGGPAPYVRRHLNEAPELNPEHAATLESTSHSCACG